VSNSRKGKHHEVKVSHERDDRVRHLPEGERSVTSSSPREIGKLAHVVVLLEGQEKRANGRVLQNDINEVQPQLI
jgi:hypothetical protein